MRITDKYVFFWGEEFSNFYPCIINFSINGENKIFHSSEQFFMWLKAKTFNDEKIANEILNTQNPAKAKRLGRKVNGFSEEIWAEKRKNAMKLALRHKFSDSNPKLKSFILDKRFNNKEFVEASPFDIIWGIGIAENDDFADEKENWRGLNLLGVCLNEIREELLSK